MLPHKLTIATVSLGWHPSHKLDRKIEAAAAHGFTGIELVHSDLVKVAQEAEQPASHCCRSPYKVFVLETEPCHCYALSF